MAECKYRTEREARLDFAVECLKFTGIKEGSPEQAALMEFYNMIDPLPRGYRMTLKDAWCAAYLCATAWKLGYRNWNFECSCSRLQEMAKADGIWRGRDYIPQVGDWVVFDLSKPWGKGDHIGVVTGTDGRKVYSCEGNFADSVKNRLDLQIGDERICGYICNDFFELVDNSDFIDGDRPNIPVEIPKFEEDEDMATEDEKIYNQVSEMPEWAQEGVQEMVDAHIIEGVGDDQLGMDAKDVRHAMWQWRGLKRICEKLGLPGLK